MEKTTEEVKRGRGRPRSTSRSRTTTSSAMKRSPGRPRSSSRGRAAASKTSPSNGFTSSTPLRQRRASRSPARRKDSSPVIRGMSLRVRKLDMDAGDETTSNMNGRSPSPGRRTRTKREREPTPTRQSARLASQRFVQVANSIDTASKPKPAFENPEIVRETAETSPLTMKEESTSPPRREFGGAKGVFLMGVSFPIMVLYFHLACVTRTCKVDILPKIPHSLDAYITTESSLVVVGFFLTFAIISVLPVGPNVNFLSRNVRMTGTFALFFELVALAIMKFGMGISAVKMAELFTPSILPAYLLALFLSVILFIIGKNPANVRNPSAQTGNVVYDFFMGRSLNPYLGPVNLKCLLVRILILGVAAFNTIFVLADYEQTGMFSPTLVWLAVSQSFYLADSLWFEESMLTTFEMMREGVGYMFSTGYFLYPFLPTLMTYFVMRTRTELPVFVLFGIVAMFVAGFYIYRASNSQKAAFRSNPNDPKIAGLETIPTEAGRKLLVAGWWGWVRHPNYFGDLLMHWSFAFATGTAGLNLTVCLIFPIMTTGLLLHRAYRNDVRCKLLYGPAWDRYCQRVKSSVFKGIY